MKVSVIIPTFNEEKVIGGCLESLLSQSYNDLEIIIVDDGSSDQTLEVVKRFPIRILKQNHQGPGSARNLGAERSRGQILVFVDADMEFDKNFISKLVEPIISKKVLGTFSKEEFVLNDDDKWSICWNINKGLPFDRMHPLSYPGHQPVFRAILKSVFTKAGGFTKIGYIDDYTLAEKLGAQAIAAPGAIFYHRNPDNLKEIFIQARWIGKSVYEKRKIRNAGFMRLISLIRFSLPLSIWFGFYNFLKFGLPQYLIFKIVYDLGVEISLLKSFLGEQKYR